MKIYRERERTWRGKGFRKERREARDAEEKKREADIEVLMKETQKDKILCVMCSCICFFK